MTHPSTVPHVLPGEAGGDTGWFQRLNDFEKQETLRHVAYKHRHWPDMPNGRFSKQPQHTYPHILPEGNLKKAFYPPIAETILNYMEAEKIAPHSELLNLRSSQAACFNFLFPLRQNLRLADEVFSQFFPTLKQVTNLEFEYTGPEGITTWLGEPPGGKRGQNRTSIDAAVFWEDQDGQEHAALIEWKYTERGYGSCSAFNNASASAKTTCLGLNVWENHSPEQVCLLCWGVPARLRRYWEHMDEAGIDLAAFRGVTGCPFQGPFYQLVRQTLVAAYLKQIGVQAQVVSVSFAGNTSLHQQPKMLRPLGAEDVIGAWNRALHTSAPPLLIITVEQLMEAIECAGLGEHDWRQFFCERYGV
jgi:hypothetical protein